MSDITDYRCFDEVERLVKQKFGVSIFVLGSTLEEIRNFWRHVGYRAEGTISEPREVSRTIVDIDSKSHGNYARQEGGDDESHDKDRPMDWYDEFVITSKKGLDVHKNKSYTLQMTESHGFKIGGNIGLKADPGFFNLAGGGVAPELGINASYNQQKTENKTLHESRDTKLSQAYEIVDKLHIPPKKKVEAQITTWAVTYEADTNLVFTVDANLALPVRYRSHISRVLGGYFLSTTYILARDLFEGEQGFQVVNENVKFTRDAKVSYISEQVEIRKKKDDL